MPAGRSGGGLTELSLRRAQTALERGQPDAALGWLEAVDAGARPKTLEVAIRYALAKWSAAAGEFGRAAIELSHLQRLQPHALYQKRLELLRRREELMREDEWRSLREKIDAAERLPSESLAPEVAGVWTCGAYHSRGRDRALPWSRLLRMAKEPPPEKEERDTILRVAAGFMCRFILFETPLVRHVDVVVAIPPDRERYAQRGMSLPDQLAQSIERQLGLPWTAEALVKTKSIQVRGLPWTERRRLIHGSMASREPGLGRARCALLVDDVTTSGATLREAARVLRAAGAADVYAVALSHAEA